MSDPEIDRRCSHCGASVRSSALFCPQCGEPIPHSDSLPDVGDSGQTGQIPRDSHWDPAETRPLMSISEISETKPLAAAPAPVPPATPSPQPINPQPTPASRERVLGRVDKIRKVSSVVIDQAAYDPSLRFILVAAALFFLFLFLLIMSKVLG